MAIDNQSRARYTVSQILALIADVPRSERDISDTAGIGATCVRSHLSTLYSLGQVHIAGWADVKNGRKRPRLYKAGPGEDMPYPMGVRVRISTSKKSQAASDAEIDATPDWLPTRKCPHPVIIRRDIAAVALFGEYRGGAA